MCWRCVNYGGRGHPIIVWGRIRGCASPRSCSAANLTDKNSHALLFNIIMSNIVRGIECRRLRRARHVARMVEGRGVFKILTGKPAGIGHHRGMITNEFIRIASNSCEKAFLSCKVNARRSGHSPRYHLIITVSLADRHDWHITRGKWPLARNPDRSRRDRYTSLKLFWPQSMAPWTTASCGKVKTFKLFRLFSDIKIRYRTK